MVEKKEAYTCGCAAASDADRKAQLTTVIKEYQGKPGALIPVLQIAQTIFGYLPTDVLRLISEEMNEPYSRVYGVVTFYSFFSRVPRGKHLIRVCMGTACYVRGGKAVLEALEKELKIIVGQTTQDRVFSLEVGRCFGACGLAPAMMINEDVHQFVKPDEIKDILAQYRKPSAG